MSSWPNRLNIDRFLLRDRLDEGMGERVALRLDDSDVTYEELDFAASRVASSLLDSGIEPGDRVLILLPDGLEFAASLFGIFRIGAVAVMLNPGMRAEAMGAIVSQSGAAGCILDSIYSDSYEKAVHLVESPPPVLMAPIEAGSADVVPTHQTSAGDPALWLFSGGTTGIPKTVVQSHRSYANTTKRYGQGALALGPDDITIAVPKLYFGYATGSNLFFPLSVGGSAVLFAGRSTPEALFDRIRRHQPTVLVNVPSAINQMLNSGAARTADLSSLRLSTSAGEALPESLYHRWVSRFGVEILDGLGTAEMWHIFITNSLGEVRPGTVGRVVPGFEVEARDDDGRPVPIGEVGRLWVRGESLANGYWQDLEASRQAFRDGWFVGGDLISFDEDGYVTHRGRADDAFKVKGKWFRPQEVESVLLEHPAVEAAAVIVVEDEAGLSKPVAFVVAGVEEVELKAWALGRLEPYKHPRRINVVPKLPKTHLGKVDRGALRRIAMD